MKKRDTKSLKLSPMHILIAVSSRKRKGTEWPQNTCFGHLTAKRSLYTLNTPRHSTTSHFCNKRFMRLQLENYPIYTK